MTEKDMVHAILAAERLIGEAGWDRLAAIAASDRRAEQAAYAEQRRYAERAHYWRRRLRKLPLEVVV